MLRVGYAYIRRFGAGSSIVEVLAEAPGHLAFQNAEEVDAYLREEREAWER